MAENPFRSPHVSATLPKPHALHTVKRSAGWFVLTTGAVFAILLAMPPGFAGVPYMGLVMFTFLGMFLVVAISERSLVTNAIVVAAFWFTLALFAAFTEPAEAQVSFVDFVLCGGVHVALQVAACACTQFIRRQLHKEREEMRRQN